MLSLESNLALKGINSHLCHLCIDSLLTKKFVNSFNKLQFSLAVIDLFIQQTAKTVYSRFLQIRIVIWQSD